jgi:hypothetical protein
MLGREDMFSRFDDLAQRTGGPPLRAQAKCGPPIPGDPIAEIVRRARETTVVFIGEAHDDPRDRAFAARVVQALRPEGYEIFAAETLFPQVDATTPEPLLSDGSYTKEPAFGAELSLAKRLGYRLVAYDAAGSRGENLMSMIFNASPRAKVIIHGGGDDEGIGVPPYIKQRTGVDPLTINQHACISSAGSEVLATGFDPPAPTRSDLFVGHGPLTFKDGRPAWRQEAGQKPAPVPAPFLAAKEPIVIEARPVDASLQVVPADRLYLKPGERLPLLLQPGRYRVDAWTASGAINSEPEMVTVP